MNAEVDGDDHLSQMARANGKRADDHHIADSHDDNRRIRRVTKQDNNQSVDFGDQLKTPLVASLIGSIALLAVGMILEGIYFGSETATSRADAQEAKAFGHQAEREAKLSREDVKNLDIHVQVLTALLQARDFNPPPTPVPSKEP